MWLIFAVVSGPSGLVVSGGYFCLCPVFYWSSDIWHAIASQDLQALSNCVVTVFFPNDDGMVEKTSRQCRFKSEHFHGKFRWTALCVIYRLLHKGLNRGSRIKTKQEAETQDQARILVCPNPSQIILDNPTDWCLNLLVISYPVVAAFTVNTYVKYCVSKLNYNAAHLSWNWVV